MQHAELDGDVVANHREEGWIRLSRFGLSGCPRNRWEEIYCSYSKVLQNTLWLGLPKDYTKHEEDEQGNLHRTVMSPYEWCHLKSLVRLVSEKSGGYQLYAKLRDELPSGADEVMMTECLKVLKRLLDTDESAVMGMIVEAAIE